MEWVREKAKWEKDVPLDCQLLHAGLSGGAITRSESKNAFSAVLSTERRVVGLCWEKL
jgi:hypothetical protein